MEKKKNKLSLSQLQRLAYMELWVAEGAIGKFEDFREFKMKANIAIIQKEAKEVRKRLRFM